MALPFSLRISPIYTLTAGQVGPFSQDWPLYAAADLQVLRLRAGVEAELVLDADYSVTGAGSTSTGFSVLLLVAAEEGDKIVLVGARDVARITTYTAERSVTPTFLNLDQNMTFAQLQEMQREVERAFKTSRFDPDAFDMEGLRLTNVGNAVDPTDAVTLGQIQDVLDDATAGATATAVAAAASASDDRAATEAAQAVTEGARDAALAAQAAAEDMLDDYLPLTGGTLTGTLTLSGSNPRLDFNDTDAPATSSISANNGTGSIVYSADAGNALASSAHSWLTDGVSRLTLNEFGLWPASNGGLPLGAYGVGFSGLYLASAGIIDWGSNNARITHSAGKLTSSVNFQAPVLTLAEQASDPATPSAGQKALFAKTNGRVYTKNSAGTVEGVGGLVNILDYGAIGDGNVANAAVNAAALTAALATGREVLIPYTAAGYHFGTNTITVGTGQRVLGENRVTLKSTVTGSNCFFLLTGYQVASGISGVTIDMNGSGASSTAIRYGLSSGVVYRTYLKDIRFLNCVEAVGDETPGSNYIVEAWWEDLRCELTRGRQFYSRKSRGFFYLNGCVVDRTMDLSTVTWEGARFEDTIGIEFNRFDVVGQVGTTPQAGAIGLVVQNAISVWMDRCLFDNSTGPGVSLITVNNLAAKNLEVYQNLTSAVLMTSVTNAQIANLFVEGNADLVGAAAGAHGVYMETCANVQISNLRSRKNTGSGVFLNASTNCQFVNVNTRDNLSVGFREFGACDYNSVHGLISTGNYSPYELLGGHSYVDVGEPWISTVASDLTGSNVNTAQPVFGSAGDAVTVDAGTLYEFEAQYWITRAAGTTSHTTGVLFGGTATFTSIDYLAQVTNPTGNALANVQQIMGSAASLLTLTAANTSATENVQVKLSGTMRINAGGTIIPQFQFSAAPGGAPTIKRGSYFKLRPITSAAAAAVGPWA
ncbi:protein of unknown function [Hyphomicrobium sp. 1Nfss2.1]|uniref:right-handed parallel beta-helix repeat-containing protein n=1 Tax=Hyphomicrobium sp. 1Nfss2.1 TaxID=3413936 RepID=UPI003C7994DA